MHSYDFILGDASSGKSRNIYTTLSHEACLHPDRHYYLFVPEQNTLKVQREIAELSERHGMLNLDVLSFQLLFYRVLEELGIDNDFVLDDISLSLLIRKAALDADKAKELSLYGAKLRCRGFIEELKDIIAEFSRYQIDEKLLLTIIDRLDERELRAKLSDILSIYKRFKALLGSEQTFKEEAPEILLRHIARSHILDDSVIVFDGFRDFQPVQIKTIGVILAKAGRVSFSFTLPESEDPFSYKKQDIADLWWLSKKSIAAIVDEASLEGVRIADPMVRYFSRKDPERNIIIHEAHDPTAEIRYVSQRIRQMALSGTRFKKIALICPDMGTYKEIIRREFSAAGIPFFMDLRAGASLSPCAELIRAALSAILSSYRYTELMRFLKNPLFGHEDETDEFDNLMRKRGARGRRAAASLAGESGADAIALRLKTLFLLDDRLKASSTLKDMADATLLFMNEVCLKDMIDSHRQRLLDGGLIQEAADEQRFGELTLELIERIAAILPDESASTEEYAQLLEAGFAGLSGGTVPETMDMVVIGDLRRSRIENISALYIVGANEGSLPPSGSGGGLLTPYERYLLSRLSESLAEGERFELAPDENIESALLYFHLYIMTHKPEEEIFISYSLSSRDGAKLIPSRVIDEIKRRARQVIFDDFVPAPYSAVSPRRLTPSARTPYLSDITALRLYGKKPEISVSRLESFASCPYAHFLSYGLRLKEREKFDIEAYDLGNLYHSALKILVSEAPIKELDDISLSAAAAHAASRAIAEYKDSVMNLSMKNRYIASALRRTLIKTAGVIRDQLKRGDFETFGTEIRFLREQEGYVLSGLIDRVDVAGSGEGTYVNVIDYKSSSKGFDEALARAGIDMQLSFYMENALREVGLRTGRPVLPGGMYFYHISDPVISYQKTLSTDLETLRAKELRLRGVSVDTQEYLRRVDREGGNLVTDSDTLSPDDFSRLTASAALLTRDFVDEMRGGNIRISPYKYKKETGCKYCPYSSCCGFDQKKGDRYRYIAPVRKEGESS